jgi:NADPH:quinone reductase
MATKTRAIRFYEAGGPEVMKIEELELPEPGPGQALVEHRAIGVNFVDIYNRSGLYSVPLPSGLGTEAAGRVLAVGEGVKDVAPGMRVAYVSGPLGSYAEKRLMPADRLVPLPDGIDEVAAAASMLKGMTVAYLVRHAYRVNAGDTVLFHAAAGGVGSIASQWLSHLGATVIGTVSTDEKAEIARAHGCAHPIVYTREDFTERVREITNGALLPVVYDSVGKSTFLKSLDCLRPRGVLVSFGNASGKPEPFDIGMLAQKGSLYVTRQTLHTYTHTREEIVEGARALFSVIESGAVKIDPPKRVPFERAAEAHRAIAARETTGSTILAV